MLTRIFITLLLLSVTASAQVPSNTEEGPEKYDRAFSLYPTYEDFTGRSPKHLGRYRTYNWASAKKGLMLYVEPDADHCEAIYDKGNWGFSIGKFVFRVYPANFPLLVLGQYGGKTLYLHARVELTMIANNSNEGIAYADENQFYYSDTPDSEIIKFDKMPKALKDSPDFQVLSNCMKDDRKESGNDAVLSEQRRCFKDYAEDF